MGLTALTTEETGSSSLGLQILGGLGFVLACFCSCFAMLALVLRFAGRRVPVLDTLKRDAYGIYLVHYIFAVWLQYALLGAGLFALGKGTIVFGGTLLFSWGTVAAVRCVPVAAQVIGADRPRGAAA
jgi:hypothetical protein